MKIQNPESQTSNNILSRPKVNIKNLHGGLIFKSSKLFLKENLFKKAANVCDCRKRVNYIGIF